MSADRVESIISVLYLSAVNITGYGKRSLVLSHRGQVELIAPAGFPLIKQRSLRKGDLRGLLSQKQKPKFESYGHGICPITGAQFCEQGANVKFGGRERDFEIPGDHLVGRACSELFEDLALALREQFVALGSKIVGFPTRTLDQWNAYPVAVGDESNRRFENVDAGVLVDAINCGLQ